MKHLLKFFLIFLIVIVFIGCFQKQNETLANQTVNLPKLSDNEIIEYAMKDNQFKNFEGWNFSITTKKIENGKLYVEMYAYKGNWDTVQHVWFYINQKGEVEQLMIYPYVKTAILINVTDEEKRKETIETALNNSKVREEIGNREFEVKEVWKYVNMFTDEETGTKVVYIQINNTNVTYAITICNENISIENTTCNKGVGWCFYEAR